MPQSFQKDNLYQNGVDTVTDFAFDENVARVFPDMVHRSIPGYATLLTVMQAVFRHYFKNTPQPLVYDLGCSVGGVTLALAHVLPADSRFIGVDNAAQMLIRYRDAIRQANLNERVEPMQADITQINLLDCDAICLNFILQFLPPESRQLMLQRCFDALKPHGICFVAEKTRQSENTQAFHEQFKRNNGYSELEIAKKRLAVEKIMQIDDDTTIVSRAKSVGFCQITPVFNALGFQGWVMQKKTTAA